MIKIKTKGVVNPYEIALQYTKDYPILDKNGNLKDGYLDIVNQLKKQGIKLDSKKINESMARLSDSNASAKAFRDSYVEGVRQGVIDSYSDSLSKESEKEGKKYSVSCLGLTRKNLMKNMLCWKEVSMTMTKC